MTTDTVKFSLRRNRLSRWAEIEVELRDGRLSVAGSEGVILGAQKARKAALDYWISYFEDSPEAIPEMNARCGTRYTSARGAAKYVLASDGELHGLDARSEIGGTVLVTESCGQIRDTLRTFFPEFAPLFPWHLNDMKAACEHQEALGWGHGRDVALDAATMTPSQREALEARNLAATIRPRERAIADMRYHLTWDLAFRRDVLKATGELACIAADDALCNMETVAPALRDPFARRVVRGALSEIDKRAAHMHPAAPVESEVFRDSIGAPCPECGYRYGTAWLKRALPPEIVALVSALAKVQS